jgi:lipopolysaccharide export system protein LptA
MLQLDRDPAGDKLQVFGDGHDKLAELQLGEMILIGPKVVIDQRDNTANVYGLGTMDMPSNTTFDGGKPAKAGARLTVNWNTSMFFNGQNAYYDGGVIAYQVQPGVKDKARLQADQLQVTLDRYVSFKEGQKAGESAKVDKLVCYKQIDAVSETYDAQGKRTQYHRMENPEMSVDNRENHVIASGPGRVSILQYGAPDALAAPGANTPIKQAVPAKKQQQEVLKLTRVLYDQRLYSNTANGARTSRFYGNVQVFHLPADDPDVKVNLDKLPKHGFYMRSDYLEVLSRTSDDRSKGQYMVAKYGVRFQTPEFSGTADTLVYNEAADTVLFQGTEGRPATVYRWRGQGVRPEEISGQRILYSRKTGQFTIEKGNRVQS